MNEQQTSALIAWLVHIEKAFATDAQIFEDEARAATPGQAPHQTMSAEQATRVAQLHREFESQARQFRAILTADSPDRVM